MKRLLILSLLMLSVNGSPQRPKITDCFAPSYEIDTTAWVNEPVTSISEVGGTSDEIDPEDLDVSLMNRAIYGILNDKRDERNRSTLAPDSLLNRLSYYYAVHKGAYLFKRPASAKRAMSRDMRKLNQMIEFNQGMIKGIFINQPLLAYKRGRAFMLYKKDDPEGELIYGTYKDTRDSGFTKEPIPRHTYESLCEELADKLNRGKYRRLLMSKYQTHMSVYVQVDERTIGKKMIPVMKIAIIFGAPRVIVGG